MQDENKKLLVKLTARVTFVQGSRESRVIDGPWCFYKRKIYEGALWAGTVVKQGSIQNIIGSNLRDSWKTTLILKDGCPMEAKL